MSVIRDPAHDNGLWIVPDLWKTRRRVSHRSLDGAQTAPPTGMSRPLLKLGGGSVEILRDVLH